MSDQAPASDQVPDNLGWRSALPDEFKEHDDVKGFEKPGDFVKAALENKTEHEALKTRMESAIFRPGEDASDEDKAAYLTSLGRPESADKYTISKPDNLPDGIPYDEATEQYFKGVFHEIGLSDDNAKVLWGKYHEMAAQGFQAQQQAEQEASDKAVNDLKDAWKGDDFKVNTELALRTFNKAFNGDEAKIAEAKEFVEKSMIGNLALGDHPTFLKVFHYFSTIIGDDEANAGRDDGLLGGDTEEENAKKRFPNTKFK